MKIKITTLLVAGSFLLVASSAFAEVMMLKAQVVTKEQAAADVASKKAVEVNNKLCPVSKEAVPVPGEDSSMGESVKIEYNGKIYNLCCKMCVKDFTNDPQKYSKIAEGSV